jgi:hypothetical protein
VFNDDGGMLGRSKVVFNAALTAPVAEIEYVHSPYQFTVSFADIAMNNSPLLLAFYLISLHIICF